MDKGSVAVADGDVAVQVRFDSAFHFIIYGAPGNPLVPTTAEPHWRFLRRAMDAVLRKIESPEEIWRQHRCILDAITSGDSRAAEALAVEHALNAAERLSDVLNQHRRTNQAP